MDAFDALYATILDRRDHPSEGSYTRYLFDKGLDKILKKVGEECAETIIAAKNGDNAETVYEIADLFYTSWSGWRPPVSTSPRSAPSWTSAARRPGTSSSST